MNVLCYKIRAPVVQQTDFDTQSGYKEELRYVFIKFDQIDILRDEYIAVFGCCLHEKSIEHDIQLTKQFGFVKIETYDWTKLLLTVKEKIDLINGVNNSVEKILA